MTREEAIELLCAYGVPQDEKQFQEALNMAIEALQNDTIEFDFNKYRLSVRNKVYDKHDCVAVVRCKDCKWYKKIVEKSKSGLCHYDLVARCLYDEDFCSHGERREE